MVSSQLTFGDNTFGLFELFMDLADRDLTAYLILRFSC